MADDVEAETQRTSNAIRQIGNDLDGLSRRAKEHVSSSGGIGKLDAMLGGLARTMLGATGVAAGFYQVAKSLETVAIATVQMQNLARDSGYAFKSTTELQGAFRLMGASTAEANRSIGNLGEKLQSLAIFKENSELWQGLVKFPGKGGEIATSLLAIAQAGQKSGDMMNATLEAVKMFNRQDAATKFAMAPLIGETISSLEKLERTLQVYKDLKIPTIDPSAAEAFLQYMVGWELQVKAVWDHVALHAMEKMQEIGKAQKDHNVSITDVIAAINSFVDEGAGHVAALMREINLVIAGYEKLKSYVSGPLESLDKFMGYGDAPKGTGMFSGMQMPPVLRNMLQNTWGALPKAGANFSGAGEETSNFSGRFHFDTLVESGKESSVTLIDIRDILQRMETGATGGSSVGGGRGGNPNSPSNQLLQNPNGPGDFRLGGPGGPLGQGGSGGIAAPAGTPIARSGMATVTASNGKTFQVDARFKDNFQGYLNDWEKAGGVVGPSSGTLGERPGNASGHPIGTAIDLNQIGRGVRARNSINPPPEVEDALAQKWGMVSGNQWRSNDQGHFGIRSMDAARAALIKQGMLPSDAEKAVKGSYFTDRTTASGLDASKIPGIATPGREGLGQMYEVTGPDGKKMMLPKIDVGPAGWTGRGIDLSGPAADAMGYGRKNFPTDSNFTYRRAIDESQKPDKWSGGLNAKVEFLNVPSGVKTSADRVGDAFQELQISRTKQMGVYNQSLGYE